MTAKPFSQMLRVFRKYHRWLAIILCLPLLLTVMTGMAYTVLVDWFGNTDAIEILLGLHTLEIVHLEKFYPLLNGLGLVGLLVTGVSMTGLFKRRSSPPSS
ncbi:MAG: peptidase [Microcystaceae cyanobacterium]